MKSWSVTIQMKATEQHFPVVLFIMLYKVVLTFESGFHISLKCVLQLKRMGQYFTEVVFTMCYNWSYFDSVVEILSVTI